MSIAEMHSRMNERKSRRSHKNSRDGCPNCKTKRIKCTEELPCCHNCIKKNYRCGYLDFSKEKLEHIKKKNEKKLNLNSDKFLISVNSQNSPPNSSDQSNSNYAAIKKNDDNQIEKSNPSHYGSSSDNTENHHVQTLPSNALHNQLYQTNSQSYQMVAYNQYHSPFLPSQYQSPQHNTRGHNSQHSINNSSNSITPQHISPFAASPSNAQPDKKDKNMEENNDRSIKLERNDPYDIFANVSPITSTLIANDFLSTKDELRGSFYKDSYLKLQNDEAYELSEFDFNKYQTTGEEVNYHLGSSNSSENGDTTSFENSKINYIRHVNSLHHDDSLHFPNSISSSVDYLPNAIVKTQKFKRLEMPSNCFLDEYLPQKNKVMNSIDQLFRPVWSKSYAKRFWTLIFNQAIVIDIYWAFFMDRSLNIVLKACNSTLQLAPTLINPVAKFAGNINRTCFTKDDLEILTKKSYNYYGILIRKLRHSINHVHIEFPAKISLFAGWSSFLHLHASIDTLSLMYNGTSSLLTKIAAEAKSIDDITPSIKTSIHILNLNGMVSLIPDYNFEVIKDIYADLEDFKKFVIHNQSLTTPNNEFILQKFLQLESFLNDLIENVYPKIQYINTFYKSKNKIKDNSNNIIYSCPSIFFQLLVNWFNSFADESLSVGSSLTALKRTFYLFFTATGRALGQVFTPIQSVLLVDPVNIIVPLQGFDPHTYHLDKLKLSESQYRHLFRLSTKLIRIIKFFEFRYESLSYYYSLRTFPSEENSSYLECINPEHDLERVAHADIIKIIPKKIPTYEKMITKFNNDETVIVKSNYPMLDEFPTHIKDPNLKSKYLKEIQSQEVKQQKNIKQKKKKGKTAESFFDYNSGLFNFDFNPKEAISIYQESQKVQFNYLQEITLEEMKRRITNFDISRREVSKAVHKNSSVNE